MPSEGNMHVHNAEPVLPSREPPVNGVLNRAVDLASFSITTGKITGFDQAKRIHAEQYRKIQKPNNASH